MEAKGGAKPSAPWKKRVQQKNDQASALLRAELASIIHQGISFASNKAQRGSHSDGGHNHKPRQAEWKCAACGRHNFLTRDVCRECGAGWSQACVVIPAMLPEKANATSPPQASGPGNLSTKGGTATEVASTANAADAAVVAAKAAGSPPELIASLQQQATSRRQAETARLPLSTRLKSATAKANETDAAKGRTEKAVERAQEALRQAQETAKAAASAAAEAAAELKRVSAEVGSKGAPGVATMPAPALALAELLGALQAADQGAEGAKERLQAAAAAAQKTLRPSEEDASMKEQATNLGASQGQKREAEPSQATVLGTQEATEDDAQALLAELEGLSPESKRQRLAQAMRNAGGT